MNSRLVPLLAFILLVGLLLVGLSISDKKTLIPSPLINKPVPAFDLPVLARPGVSLTWESFLGKPYLVNFWASWCPTCRVEHPVVTKLAERNIIDVIGLNFRDLSDDANAWLERYGDPYTVSLVDADGRISIDFGVYAAPETFLVDPSGTIVFKHIGALTEEVIENDILPLVMAMESDK